jgi:hypothetical protein
MRAIFPDRCGGASGGRRRRSYDGRDETDRHHREEIDIIAKRWSGLRRGDDAEAAPAQIPRQEDKSRDSRTVLSGRGTSATQESKNFRATHPSNDSPRSRLARIARRGGHYANLRLLSLTEAELAPPRIGRDRNRRAFPPIIVFAQQVLARITTMTRRHDRRAAAAILVVHRTEFGRGRSISTDELATLERTRRAHATLRNGTCVAEGG